MRTKIFGKRYEFIIELEQYNNAYYFEIFSLFKATSQKSSITNLNFIISELIFPVLGTTNVDTTVFLNKLHGVELFKKSISSFTNLYWVELLEKKLDEDRGYSGWNSNFKI